ncbi:hypothetical protein [Streptomyces sp. NPDC046939]|uniref:hypothetical protein n=1 Tax=Streptomyces sp. NPDC046939 TaxID=3155376 RepID=UPI0033E547B3
MQHTRELIDSVGSRLSVDSDVLARTVHALSACAQASSACAAGMLADKDADSLREAITQNLDCADVTHTTVQLLLRGDDAQRPLIGAQLAACLIACREARDVCGRHAAHREHCRLCAEAAGQATEACENLGAALRP